MMANALKSNEIAQRVRALVEEALIAKGVSARRASLDTVGHDGLVRDIRAGRLPGIDKLEALFSYLEIGFQFGKGTAPTILGGDAQPPSLEIGGDDFATIKRIAAQASAGPGALNDDAQVIGHMAFRHDWLAARGINPGRCVLLTVKGDSMDPSFRDGDLVMLDRDKTEIDNGKPYILTDIDGETKLKRIHVLGRAGLVLVSDNAAHPPELRNGADAERVKVLGRVVWSGHNWG